MKGMKVIIQNFRQETYLTIGGCDPLCSMLYALCGFIK